MISRGLAPIEKAKGMITGLTIAGIPHALPVLKFSMATRRKVITGNSCALISGCTL